MLHEHSFTFSNCLRRPHGPTHRRRARLDRPTARALLAALLLALLSAAALAQSQQVTDGSTPSALTPGSPAGSYSLSGFETVNPYNGGLNFSLPLLTIDGRGGASYTITLRIDQKWVIRKQINPGHAASFYPTPTWTNPEGGAVLQTYSVGKMTHRYGNSRDYVILSNCGYVNRITLTRLNFIAPDGTEYELRDQQTNGTPHFTDAGTCQPGQLYSRGRVFVTADGSSATFIADSDITDYPYEEPSDGATPGVMILKDGTRFRTDTEGRVVWMRDRNGNLVNFAYTYDGSGHAITTVTDSLGRQTVITQGGSPTVIAYKGFGGVDRTVKVYVGSLGSALRPDFQLQTQNTLFPGINNPVGTSYCNPQVITSVELPDARTYQFRYNSYGELARVVVPTGGAFEYDYAAGLPDGDASGMLTDANRERQVYRRVVERRIYPDGGAGSAYSVKQVFSRPETTTYNVGYADVLQCVSGATGQCDPGPALLTSERHFYYGSPRLSFNKKPYEYTTWQEGKEYRSEAYDPQTGALLRRVETTWQQPVEGATWPLTQPETNGSAKPNNPQVTQVQTTIAESNQVSRQEFSYDQYGNKIDSYEYGYGVGAPGPLARRAHVDYVTSAAYVNADANIALGASLRSLPQQEWVSSDAAGANKVSLTVYGYDQYGLADCPGIVGHDGGYSTGFGLRGNVTSETLYADATGAAGAVTASKRYDVAGNLISSTDPRGNTAYVSYADSFSDGVPRNTYAFPTGTSSPVPDPTGQFGSTAALTNSTVYEYYTGLATATTDANLKTTSYQYGDALGRPTRVDRPDGGWTTYAYDRNQYGDYVHTRVLLNSAGAATDTYSYTDGLGRPSRTFTNDPTDPSNPWLTSDTQYNALGKVWRVSNPYRSPGPASAPNPSSRWTTTEYDALGRVTKVTTPDGATRVTSYWGNQATATDESGRKTRRVQDALGRLVRVDEQDAAGNLGSPDSPAQPTFYTYDAHGNLRRVEQGGQLRFFMYDSLSRLVRVKNPEQAANGSLAVADPVTGNSQWSVAYGYDANGNRTSRVDARGVTTAYGYDALNRLTTVRYSDGTKDVDRHYDGAVNGRGRFHYFNWDPNNNARFDTHLAVDEYDAMGRVVKYRQHFLTNGNPSPQFTVTRAYDLAGNVLTQTYPSGHAVSYSYDAAGRVSGFNGNLGDGVSRTYAAGVTYSEFGGVRQEQFGTQTPLYHKLHYNRRGQLFDIRLSTQSLAANEWDWNRGAIVNYYSTNYAWEGDPNTPASADNNGNLLRQQHWVPADDATSSFAYTQDTFEYDSVNRLRRVSEVHGGPWGQSGQDFAQSYNYDRWGNRTIDAGLTSGAPGTQFELSPQANQEVPEPSNRLYAPGDSGRAAGQKLMRYDAAGNLVYDGYQGGGSRAYDANNRMTAAVGYDGNWDYYSYDADGRRVKRKIANQEVWQVYGIEGELLAEYPAGAAPFLTAKEYGYRGGELLVTISSGDTDRTRRFVRNLYYNALARDPSQSELQQRMDQLGQAGAQGGESQLLSTARSMARGLFETAEYAQRGRTDEQYVTDLYNAYLQRAPDAGGLNFWVQNTQSNGRGATLNAFEVSTEFATLAATIYGREGEGENQRVEHFVRTLYYGARRQEPSAADMQSKTQRLNNAAARGQSQVIAEARAIGGEVFVETNYNASRTTQEYVTDLYEAFLQRAPDGPGLNFWVQNTVNNGRAATLSAFQQAGEFAELAGTLYRETFWLVPDQLGTPRIVADRTGSLAGIRRHDYLPFGEELYASTGGRATAQGYNAADNVRQKYIKYERDAETALDYVQARYFAGAQGRFTSVDPENAGADEEDPQSWNGYAYSRNSPVVFVDPDGLAYIVCGTGADCYRMDDSEAKFGLLNPSWQRSIGSDISWSGREGTVYVNGQFAGTVTDLGRDYWTDAQNRLILGELPNRLTPVKKVVETVFDIETSFLPAGRVLSALKIGRVGRAGLGLLTRFCFVAGTPVLTRDGPKPIEELKEGDEVLSYDEKTGQNEFRPVVQTFVRHAGEVLSLHVEGEAEPLGVTPEHPFFARAASPGGGPADGEWTQAGALRPGDEIRLASGGWARVLRVERRPGGAKVYNFEVADHHNYFVGRTGLLAHNACGPVGTALQKLGMAAAKGSGKGVLEVAGTSDDALMLFNTLRGGNKVKMVSPGVWTAKSSTGSGTVTFRYISNSGPPTVDVHGIEQGLRKIKFIN